MRMTKLQDAVYWSIADWETNIRLMGPPKRSLLHSNPKTYYDKMEEFIMASKYIMSRFYSNFYYPDDVRSSTKPSTRDELHHIGKILKYLYKPTGDIEYSKKIFVDNLYKYELQKIEVDKINLSKSKYNEKAKKDFTKSD